MTSILILMQASGGPNYGYSWGLILLSLVLGLVITLKSPGRVTDFKRPPKE